MSRHRQSISIGCNVRVIGWRGSKDNIVYEYETHNVLTTNGRNWLAQLVLYDMTGYTPLDPPPDAEPGLTYLDSRLMYLGLGIGGNKQSGPIPAAVDGDYPPFNTPGNTYDQTYVDTPGLERPVRLRSFAPAARWLVPVTYTEFRESPILYFHVEFDIQATDINHAPWPPDPNYPIVPISEAALFFHNPAANMGTVYPGDPPLFAMNEAIAYITQKQFPKTDVDSMTYYWYFYLN